jgi:hypothetical protein
MAGNYPRIPGITLGLGLVHYPLLSILRRLVLLLQSDRLASLLSGDQAEQWTTCPSSNDITRDRDGSCSEDRRDLRSPWTTL